ncbi:response regulator [Maridesulfovibrio sp. FT414]|uniref:response regulator n=1 Tax=Maridesulfovibrio sp. FT414 TaxID=2979469 RepID=UPI003D801C75
MNALYPAVLSGGCAAAAFAAGFLLDINIPAAVAVGVLGVAGVCYVVVSSAAGRQLMGDPRLEQALSTCLAAAGTGYYRTDLSGQMVYHAKVDNFWTAGRVKGLPLDWEQIFAGRAEKLAAGGELFEALCADKKECSFETEVEICDGSRFIFAHTVTLILDEKGRPAGCVGTVQDITELESLRREKGYLDSVMNGSTDSVFIQDFQGNFLKVNDVFANYAGASRPEACVGLGLHNFLSPQVADKVLQDISAVAEDRGSLGLRIPVVDSRGNKIRFDLRHCLHRNSMGEPEAIIGYARELDLSRDEGERCRKVDPALLESLSHELRTPVAGMIGSLQVLEGEELSASAREFVGKCILSAQRLKKTVNSILQEFSGERKDVIDHGHGTDACSDVSEGSSGLGLNILLAEDDMSSQVFMRRTLELWGCNVRTASNGSEVLKYLAEQECDLVLMDIQMPEMSGYEAIAGIRALGTPVANLPIIVMSAYGEDSDRKKMDELGVTEFIAKPVRVETLKAAMERIFNSDSRFI